jgi:MATE family multidrug resistance protein
MSDPAPTLPSRSLPRQLLHLAWPVLIAQAAVMANGLVDTLMAGRISAEDLAAVGVGASIYATVFIAAMGVLLALPPIISHHYGARCHLEIGADVRQSAWLALALSIVAMFLLHFPETLLQLSRISPALEIKVRAYLAGVAWAIPGVLFFRVFYGLLVGIGKPRPVMLLNLLGLALKVPLNAAFMYGAFGFPAMGGAGAGWSTAVSMSLVTLLGWFWCYREADFARYAIFDRFEWPRAAAIKELLRLGVPTGLSFLVDVTAFTFMALFIARLGAANSAAHQVAASVAIFLFTVPLALGNATGVLVGHSLGAGNRAQARAAGLLGLRVGVAVGVLIGVLIGLNARGLASLYTSDPEVVRIAAGLLLVVAFHHPADALQAVMAQVLRGYKRAIVPMLVYAFALWGIGLSGGYVLGLTDLIVAPLGAAGFWISGAVGLFLAGGLLLAYFMRVSGQGPSPIRGQEPKLR